MSEKVTYILIGQTNFSYRNKDGQYCLAYIGPSTVDSLFIIQSMADHRGEYRSITQSSDDKPPIRWGMYTYRLESDGKLTRVGQDIDSSG